MQEKIAAIQKNGMTYTHAAIHQKEDNVCQRQLTLSFLI